jgi:hypothetical protein
VPIRETGCSSTLDFCSANWSLTTSSAQVYSLISLHVNGNQLQFNSSKDRRQASMTPEEEKETKPKLPPPADPSGPL